MKINKYHHTLAVALLLLCLTACSGDGFPEISKLVTLGNDEKEPIVIPKPLFFTVSAGESHSLAIYGRVNEAWNLYAWGYNGYRQLGDGTSRSKNSPTQIGNAANWLSITAGKRHSLAISKDGKLYAWGDNDKGQLGDNTTTTRRAPTQIGNATNWVKVAAGASHSLAIDKDGELYAWGWNFFGQLGDTTTRDRRVPKKIGNATNWVKVAAGASHSLAINKDGEL